MYQPKVYTASKIRHKAGWLQVERLNPEVEFTARWLRMPDSPDLTDIDYWSPEDRARLWIQNIQDVQRSDYVLSFVAPEDLTTVKGTLVEIGCAIGLGKVVHAAGYDHHHSWTNHPLVIRHSTMQHALDAIIGGHS